MVVRVEGGMELVRGCTARTWSNRKVVVRTETMTVLDVKPRELSTLLLRIDRGWLRLSDDIGA
jgi:hypothetical protein